MSGIRTIYVTESLNVHRVSRDKSGEKRPLVALANQTVLDVLFYYETVNRKPSRMVTVSFNRIRLNDEGADIITDEDLQRSMQCMNSVFWTPEEEAEGLEYVSLPTISDYPTPKETECIYNYLKNDLPTLYPDGCFNVDLAIRGAVQINEKRVRRAKEVARIKGKRK